MTWQQTIEDRVREVALDFQSRGPDEFPFEYYLHLARIDLGVEETT